jgi:rhamnosyltransferase
MDLVLCIPTLNPGAWVEPLLAGLRSQTLQPTTVVVLDSQSTDGSPRLWADAGVAVRPVPRADFDHGGTRNLAFDVPGDAYLFLTHDAIPTDPRAFEILVDALSDPEVGLAYGRQIPRGDDLAHRSTRRRDGASMAAAHRLFNYPPVSARRTRDDIPLLGVRAAFCSNAFAVYRRDAIEAVGRFPAPIIGSEDRYVAAKMLDAGWEIAYVAEACVEHSHDDSLTDDFRRYFDIGAFQASERWFETRLGRAEGEAVRLVRHQVVRLRSEGVPLALGRVLGRTTVRFLGYRAGRAHRRLPATWCARLSSHPAYWRRPASTK